LINNAAIFSAAPISEVTRQDYTRVFDINVAGTLFTLQAVAEHMIERGIKGRIINMASQAGRRGESLVAVYCASKAAIISLTQSAGLNLIQHGINVNAIAPGWWTALIGMVSMLFLQNTKVNHWVKRRARLVELCPLAEWVWLRT
jgi:D-sorbitol dehydrogenase (acceptor)